MSFIWPAMLLLLLLVPLLVLLYLRLQQRRKQLVARYGSLGLVQGAGGQQLGVRRHVPALLFLAGLIILLIAMARPQATVSLPRVEGTVILAFDVSGSMAADDLAPTRMEAAKEAARKFVQNQPSSVLIGLVAFSDSGFSVQAPTSEQEMIFAAIDRLEPQRGTSLAQGIFASLNAILVSLGESPLAQTAEEGAEVEAAPTPTPVPEGTYAPAAIVLLTDGDNNEPPDPLEAAQAAVDRGVRIYTIGIGSQAGATLDINGFSVHTQLNEELLQQIAQLTGGTYYHAENEEELQEVYANLIPQLVVKAEEMEVTSIFAGASILVFLAGGLLSLLWFSRLP